MTFNFYFYDPTDPDERWTASLDCELTDEEIRKVAKNYRETLEEFSPDEFELEELGEDEDFDMFGTELMELNNLVVFGAVPELEARFDAATAEDAKQVPLLQNGYVWGQTDRWEQMQANGKELSIPEFYLSDIPDEIKQVAKTL